MSTDNYNPPVGFSFKLTVKSIADEESFFQEVSGLNAKLGAEDVQQGARINFNLGYPNRSNMKTLF